MRQPRPQRTTPISTGMPFQTTCATAAPSTAILTSDFSNSTRFFLEKMFFSALPGLSRLRSGLACSTANRAPIWAKFANTPMASAMPTGGAIRATARVNAFLTVSSNASWKVTRSSHSGVLKRSRKRSR